MLILIALYTLALLWLLVAALAAWWRTRWGSWAAWAWALLIEALLAGAGLATLLSAPAAPGLAVGLFVLFMSAPLLVALALVALGRMRLEGFAGASAWLRLARPDPALKFPERPSPIPPSTPSAPDADQGLWVPPVPLWAPVETRRPLGLGCWVALGTGLLMLVALVALVII